MKRVIIASIIIVLCLCFCLFSYTTITKASRTLAAKTAKIEQLLTQEDFRQIKKACLEIRQDWEHYAFPFSLLTTHVHYDTLEECVDKLYHAGESEDKKEIKRACDDLIFEANHIITSISPKGENVF